MKSVWIDSGIDQRLTTSSTFDTGLLLGQAFDPTRSYLLHSIPTPPVPDLPPSSSFTSHTSQWLLAHALQVDRMTLPGLSLLGLYVRSSADDLRGLDSSNALRDLVFALPGAGERFVVKCSGGKLTCDAYGGSKKEPGRGRPTLVKVQPMAASLVQFRCCMSIDWVCRVDRLGSGGPGERAAAVLQAAAQLGDALKGCITTVDGERRDGTTALEKAFTAAPEAKVSKGKSKKAVAEAASDSDGDGVHRIDVYTPLRLLTPSLEPPPGSSSSSFAFLHLRGSLLSRAFIHPKSSVGHAVAAVHRDLCASLYHRLQLLLDDEEEEGRGGAWGEEGEGVRALGRRIIVNLGDGLALGDYLVDGESEADGLRRMEELAAPSRPLTPQSVQEVEGAAVVMQVPHVEGNVKGVRKEEKQGKQEEEREEGKEDNVERGSVAAAVISGEVPATEEGEQRRAARRKRKKRASQASSVPQLSSAAFTGLCVALLLAVTLAFWLRWR